jgi:hypothetical protein
MIISYHIFRFVFVFVVFVFVVVVLKIWEASFCTSVLSFCTSV